MKLAKYCSVAGSLRCYCRKIPWLCLSQDDDRFGSTFIQLILHLLAVKFFIFRISSWYRAYWTCLYSSVFQVTMCLTWWSDNCCCHNLSLKYVYSEWGFYLKLCPQFFAITFCSVALCYGFSKYRYCFMTVLYNHVVVRHTLLLLLRWCCASTLLWP